MFHVKHFSAKLDEVEPSQKEFVAQSGVEANAEPASGVLRRLTCRNNAVIAAGVTPEIRDAAPSVEGENCCSL